MGSLTGVLVIEGSAVAVGLSVPVAVGGPPGNGEAVSDGKRVPVKNIVSGDEDGVGVFSV
ncbi:MAG TPA: hypothetical protein VF326_00750 [Anaerolineaceae bacterium]